MGAARTVVCLFVGALLWLGWGAVGGVAGLQVTAGAYLMWVVLAGAAFGLFWPGPNHLRTGVLLVLPGLVALFGPWQDAYPDLMWWALTVVVGAWAAAASHWLAVEARDWGRTRRRRSRGQHS